MAVSRLNLGTTNQVLVKAASGQTSNILEAQNSSGSVVAGLSQSGVWSGSAAPGLVLLNTTTFSGVGSVSLPANTFTSTYTNYRIIFVTTVSTSPQIINFQLKSGATTRASNYYYGGYEVPYVGANTSIQGNSTTSIPLGQAGTAIAQMVAIELRGISGTSNNYMSGTVLSSAAGALAGRYLGFARDINDANDSAVFTPVANTITGTYSVYGYNA